MKKIEDGSASDNILIGTWSLREVCKYSSASGYVKMDQVYTNSTFDQTATIYSDSVCTVPLVAINLTGTYFTSNYKSTTAEEGMDIDSTLSGYLATAKSSTLVSTYNTNSYCGFSDWQINVAKSLLGRTCDGSVMPSAGTIEYSFYRKSKISIMGQQIGDLLFGTDDASHNGTSPSQRYVVLDGTFPLKKAN